MTFATIYVQRTSSVPFAPSNLHSLAYQTCVVSIGITESLSTASIHPSISPVLYDKFLLMSFRMRE